MHFQRFRGHGYGYGAAGPAAAKAGALALAVLANLLSQPDSISDGSLLLNLKGDVQAVMDFLSLRAVSAGQPAHTMDMLWATCSVFGKLLKALGQTPEYKSCFGNDWEMLTDAEGPTLVEIKAAHLNGDVVDEEEEERLGRR